MLQQKKRVLTNSETLEFFRRLVDLRHNHARRSSSSSSSLSFRQGAAQVMLQQTVEGETVQTLDELYTSAQRIRPQFEALLEHACRQVTAKSGGNVSLVVAECKGRDRAAEKARLEYTPRSTHASFHVVDEEPTQRGKNHRDNHHVEESVETPDRVHGDEEDEKKEEAIGQDEKKEEAIGQDEKKEEAIAQDEKKGEAIGQDEKKEEAIARDDKKEEAIAQDEKNDDNDDENMPGGVQVEEVCKEDTEPSNDPGAEESIWGMGVPVSPPPPPISLLRDIVRASIVCDSGEEITHVVNWLETAENCQVVQTKNRFAHPNPLSGYRDVLLHIAISSNNGQFHHICEVQIHDRQTKEEFGGKALELYQYFWNDFAGMDSDAQREAVQKLLGVVELSSLVNDDDFDDCSLEETGNLDHDEETSLVRASVEQNSPLLAAFSETQLHEYPLALMLRVQLHDRTVEKYGQESREAAASHYAIGHVCFSAGEYEDALRAFWKGLQLREALLEKEGGGQHNTEMGESYHHVAGVFEKMGDAQRALALYRKSLEMATEGSAKERAGMATTHCRLAGLLSKKENYDEALDHVEKAIAIQEQVLGTNHMETALSYNTVGILWVMQGDEAMGLTFLQKALAIRQDLWWGQNHVDVAESYANVGGAQSNLGLFDEALESFQKALEMELHLRDCDASKTYYNKGLVYKRMGNYKAAVVEYRNALQLREMVWGVHHAETKAMREALASLRREQDEFLKSQVRYEEDKEYVVPQEGVTYLILHPPSGKVLDVYANGTENGSNVHLWESNGRSSQTWRVIHHPNDEMAIVSVPANKVLDIKRGGTWNGSNVQLHEDHGGANQRWKYEHHSGLLTNPKSGKALDRRWGSMNNGANIHIWSVKSAGSQEQSWRFVPLH